MYSLVFSVFFSFCYLFFEGFGFLDFEIREWFEVLVVIMGL